MKSVLEKPLDFIREHQIDVSLALILASGLIGIYFQTVLPAVPGAEMWNLARNIADHGTFANPFASLATGPTAVNPPLYPLILAGLIKVFRVMYLSYNASVLGCILANAITTALLPRISVVFLGDSIPGIIASILWLAAMQSIPGWDTNYTVAGLLFFCYFTASCIGVDRNAGRYAAFGGTVAGLLWLLNPSSMLVSLPWIGFMFWRARANSRRTVRYCGIIVTVFCVFVIGWCGRNYLQLGGFVVRTNLGMTLNASNNDCAQSSMIEDELNGCYGAHHPNESVREAELLRTMGEIQYDSNQIAKTKAWIRANPARFLKLTMTRTIEFWFPAREVIPPGYEYASNFGIPHYAQSVARQQNRIAYTIWIITILSLPGLVLMARRREPFVLFVVAVMAIYPLMYYVVVSDLRYRYPVIWLSLLPAGYFIRELLNGSGLAFRKTSSACL
jgi:hypothetical protein